MITWYVVYTVNGSILAKFIFKSDAEKYISQKDNPRDYYIDLEYEK